MTLVADVARLLERQGVSFAMIGAAAMAVHGVSRSTADVDLLTMDVRCLDAAMWRELPSAAVDVRRGDADDPLAGVVRTRRTAEPDVDLIVGRGDWQRQCFARAELRLEHGIRVVTLADLMLLKLYAGGSHDAWDIDQLLTVDVSGDAARDVDAHVGELPADARALWMKIRHGR